MSILSGVRLGCTPLCSGLQVRIRILKQIRIPREMCWKQFDDVHSRGIK